MVDNFEDLRELGDGSSPDVALIHLGTNDLTKHVLRKGPKGRQAATTASSHCRVQRRVLNSGASRWGPRQLLSAGRRVSGSVPPNKNTMCSIHQIASTRPRESICACFTIVMAVLCPQIGSWQSAKMSCLGPQPCHRGGQTAPAHGLKRRRCVQRGASPAHARHRRQLGGHRRNGVGGCVEQLLAAPGGRRTGRAICGQLGASRSGRKGRGDISVRGVQTDATGRITYTGRGPAAFT